MGRVMPPDNIWVPFDFLVGTWQGAGEGKPGSSRVERRYEFVLNGRFLRMENKSIYEPQEKNPQGEVHEDWGLISYDRARETFVFRQFHVEGFVNQYVLDPLAEDGQTLRFVTEAIENIPPGWRARETYRKLNQDEFIEVFELAEPGGDFGLYSESRLLRLK